METLMATFSTEQIAAQLSVLAEAADVYAGDPASSADIAGDMSEMAGPCAVHPYIVVRDSYIRLTARCDTTIFHSVENAFSPDQSAPANEARLLATALLGRPEVSTLTLEMPAEDGYLNGPDFESVPF
jgi:hypothetical protein